MHSRFRGGTDLRALGLASKTVPQGGLLGEGLFASNIDRSTPGLLRVALWNEWRAMLEDLRQVGPVWCLARNGFSVLAVRGAYPEMTFSPDLTSAHACRDAHALFCNFAEWRRAAAFESACCCGPTYGIEIENRDGDIFHRVCLVRGTPTPSFVEWTQTHQATGLETSERESERKEEESPCLPGMLEFAGPMLRSVLLNAAHREIPLVAAVSGPGISQSAQVPIERAAEKQGWLVFSHRDRVLYVEAEPAGTLRAERRCLDGEPVWSLSLTHPDHPGTLRLQTDIDHAGPWNRLIDEVLF